MKRVSLFLFFFISLQLHVVAETANPNNYLTPTIIELQKQWPGNRTINIVFHGHSVPSGYFTGGAVHTLSSYPHMTLRNIKNNYSKAVVNVITTSIGGENAERGETRFATEVLTMRPDVLYIDYALNDRSLGLERAKTAWIKMIEAAQEYGCRLILMTPTPDTTEDILNDTTLLAQHAEQIRQLASQYGVGLIDSYAAFKAIAESGESLSGYMSQNNHPNEIGHEVVAAEIYKWYQISDEVPTSNLHFDFETSTATETTDKLSNIVGTFSGASVVVDSVRGNVLSLPTNGSNMRIGADSLIGDEFSLSFWVKVKKEEFWKNVFCFEESTGKNMLGLVKENWFTQKQFCVYKHSVAGITGVGEMLQPEVWYHILLSISDDSGVIYLNGVQKGSAGLAIKDHVFTNFYLGTPNNTTAISYLDDVMFFNNAFTAESAQALYEEQLPSSTTGVGAPAASKMVAYPNPAKVNEPLTISDDALQGVVSCRLVDLDGKVVSSTTLVATNGHVVFTPQEKGVFLLQLTTTLENKQIKIIVS